MKQRRAASAVLVAAILLGVVALGSFLRGRLRMAGQHPSERRVTPSQRPPPPAAAPQRDKIITNGDANITTRARLARPAVLAGPAGGSIEGRVLSSASGLPLAFAELTFQRDEGASSVRADARGAFVFAPGKPGHYRVAAVSAEGFLPFAPAWGHSDLMVSLAEGQRVTGVEIRLTPATAYLVAVVDQAGKPVPAAEVRVLGAETGELALLPLSERAATDQRGEAQVRAPDGAVLEARKDGHAPGRAAIDLSARITRRVEVHLGKGAGERGGTARIQGRVVDGSGAGVASALVLARREWQDRALHPPAQTTSAENGSFLLDGLDDGGYELEARAEGFARGRLDEVRTGTADVELRLQAGGRVRGRVTDARSGQPIASFTVLARRRRGPLRTEIELARAFIDPGGEYELTSLMPGEVTILAAAEGHAPSGDVSITITDQPARADLALAAGVRVSGVVQDRDSRAPLPAARISVEGWRGETAAPVLRIDATTDESGRFTLEGLSGAAFSFVAEAAGHHARIVAVSSLPAEGDAPPVLVQLSRLAAGEQPGFELAGIGAVLSADGETLLVRQVLPGGGAQEAGLGPGDRVVAIDGSGVQSLGFEGALSRIRGPEGSSVVLAIRRGDAAPAEVVVWRKLVRG